MRTPEQKALLQRVIDWLAAGAPHTKINENVTLTGFNYLTFFQPEGDPDTTGHCGTTGCIAGAAVQFASPSIKMTGASGSWITDENIEFEAFMTGEEAQRLLGLTDEEKELLFWPFDIDNEDLPEHLQDPKEDELYRILHWTRDLEPEAIAVVLQHFQDTNIIDWDLAH